jgi:hypothetical protein
MEDERKGQRGGENTDKLSEEEDKSAGEEDGAGDPTVKEKKKKAVNRKPVKTFRAAELVEKERGLMLLYQEMRRVGEREAKRAETLPDQALGNYMKAFKDWGYNLAPKLQFDFFMEKVQKLGKEAPVQEELHKLRLLHKHELGYDAASKAFVSRAAGSEGGLAAGRAGERPQAREYNAGEDAERAMDGLVNEGDLDYQIKKRVRMNEVRAELEEL